MADEKWEFIIIFLLGLFIGWLLRQTSEPKPTGQKTSTHYTKTEDGFHIEETLNYM